VDSLSADLFAVTGGSDGATLYPFERIVRSLDGGATWTRFNAPLFTDERGFNSGAIVAADGRLLVLLTEFADDGRGLPTEHHRGLYASAGRNWSTYRPLVPRFSPALAETRKRRPPIVSVGASSEPDPVIWVTTWDRRLYVSTDDGASFREIPAR